MAISDSYGEKRNALIAAGNAGHRIAIIGRGDFNLNEEDLRREDAEILRYKLPQDYAKIKRLTKYTLCIIEYSAFANNEQQQTMVKQMQEALRSGVNFCFIHYREDALADSAPFTQGHLRDHYNRQIGCQILFYQGIRTHKVEFAIHKGKILRNEFSPFLDKWGASSLLSGTRIALPQDTSFQLRPAGATF